MQKSPSLPTFNPKPQNPSEPGRFDSEILRFLIDSNIIQSSSSNIEETIQSIFQSLQKYFFVKIFGNSAGNWDMSLHDEMARLIRQHVWSAYDLSGQKQQKLFEKIIEYYDSIIKTDSLNYTLRVRKLITSLT